MSKQFTIYNVLNIEPPFRERHPDDFYETPARLTEELLKQIDISGTILEPCTGKGAIESVLTCLPESNVIGTDLNIDACGMPTNATTKKYWKKWQKHFNEEYPDSGLNWVVTNPPFNQAHLILPLAFEHCNHGVAFLLRSSYSEPCDNRREWLKKHADNFYCRIDINPRPQFRKEKGSDLATCTWFVWLKHWSWKTVGMRSPFRYITDWKD